MPRAELEAAREEAAARAKEAERLRRALDATVPRRNKGLVQLVAACFAGTCCGGGARSARRRGALRRAAAYCGLWRPLRLGVSVLWCEVLRLLHPVGPLVTLTLLLIAVDCILFQLSAAYCNMLHTIALRRVRPLAALAAAYWGLLRLIAAYCTLGSLS